MRNVKRTTRRGTILLMIVGLLAMLFIVVSAYIMLARFDRQTLGYARQGQRVEDIVDAINDYLMGRITEQMKQSQTAGGAQVTGYAETSSGWLSGGPVRKIEPIGVTGTGPANYVVTPTNLGSAPAPNVPLRELMADGNADGTINRVPGAIGLDPADLQVNARGPLTDADGDGVLDAYFADPTDPTRAVGTRALTEMANAMVGRAVNTAGVTPWTWNSDQRFRDLARYILAVRVVSHGGMVSLGVPPNAGWVNEFARGMVNWVLHPLDTSVLTSADDALLQQFWAARDAVEPVLRRRGGMLPGELEASATAPPPLAALYQQRRFDGTLRPLAARYGIFSSRDPAVDQLQRFNFANLQDWNVWRQATYLDPQAFNSFLYDNVVGDGGRGTYLSRHLLTSYSVSHELARVWRDTSATARELVGLYPGQLNYYLGRISLAFDKDGKFNTTVVPTGPTIVRELADYFYEMLMPYDGWKTGAGGPTETEAVTRREQAFMLAVNLVAFAAPRDKTTGNIDAVYYPDTDSAGATKLYVGYAPQPFITQVVAYNQPDAGLAHVAVAVELYNPNDSAVSGTLHDLDLSRYAISINDEPDPSGAPLDPTKFGKLDDPQLTNPGPLGGRAFRLLAIEGSGKTPFNDANMANPLPNWGGSFNTVPVLYLSTGDPIVVKLWRYADKLGRWYLVDQIDVDTQTQAKDAQWYVNVKRDTAYEPYLGNWNNDPNKPGRWRMPVAFGKDASGGYDAEYKSGMSTGTVIDQALMQTLGLGAGEGPADDGTKRYGPCVPLYTMNANVLDSSSKPKPVTVMVHGAARPASFPTVGFMLFTPRFSHVIDLDASSQPTKYTAMSRVLRDQWIGRKYASVTAAPADFGHMPIFDNNQKLDPNNGAFKDTGTLPWGLLVFDYFTTLNQNDANADGVENASTDPNDVLDMYRVPGRIDINTAPWNVLAALPVIGPDRNGNLPIHTSTSGAETNAAAAFWSPKSGVLAGSAVLASKSPPVTLLRFSQVPKNGGVETPGDLSAKVRDPSGWYRLGPYLAEAAAAYRDRIRYVTTTNGVFPDAAWERMALGSAYPYRPAAYGTGDDGIRGSKDQLAGPTTRGFLSIGELANVMGFDSSTADDINAGVATAGATTVLGGYGLNVGGDFMKAVSLMALLDTHFLTTRSNVFTIYVTVNDLENPQASVRSQLTVDRSNLLPRLIWVDSNGNGVRDPAPTDQYNVLTNDGQPEIIGQREIAYFNTRYDE
jgi:hypothetical protein